MDNGDEFHPSLAHLSDLELLDIATPLPSSSLRPIAQMLGLRHAGLRFGEGGQPPASLAFSSYRLQSLILRGGDAVSVRPSLVFPVSEQM